MYATMMTKSRNGKVQSQLASIHANRWGHELVSGQQMPWSACRSLHPAAKAVDFKVFVRHCSAGFVNNVGCRWDIFKENMALVICNQSPCQSCDIIQHSLIGPAANHASQGGLVVNEKKQKLPTHLNWPCQKQNCRTYSFNSVNVLGVAPP